MNNPFTMRRWKFQQWQMYLLVGLAWASMWQMVDAREPDRWGVSLANFVGSVIALAALHLDNHQDSRQVERWAYIAIIWSMTCYLHLALQNQGWWGLVHQPNLGIIAAEAILIACIHRTIYTLLCSLKRRRQRAFPHDEVQLEADEDA